MVAFQVTNFQVQPASQMPGRFALIADSWASSTENLTQWMWVGGNPEIYFLNASFLQGIPNSWPTDHAVLDGCPCLWAVLQNTNTLKKILKMNTVFRFCQNELS